MSIQSPRLSLEQLRKQAKELLKAHRAGDPTAIARLHTTAPQLADAQHVLARASGFPSWAALVRHARANPPGLERFEALADTVAAAYTTGDFEAIRELNWTYGTSFAWERNLDRMQQWLPAWYAEPQRTPELAHADARRLVARQNSFESWDELVRSLTPVRKRSVRADWTTTPFLRFDPAQNCVVVHGVLATSHWDTVMEVIRENRATGLRAGGMTDDALERIAELEQLTHLDLDGAGQLTDNGLRHLAKLPCLESLDLSSPRSQITDRGLEVLRHLSALRRVKFCWVPHVTDAGMAHLEACPSLESVNLMGTHTGDGTLQALAGKAALRDLTTGRQVTDVGLTRLHDIPAFRTWRDSVPDELQTRLLLDGPFTDQGLSALAGLDGLYQLGFFWHASAMTSAGLAALAALPHLGALGCEGALCDDTAMRHIAAIPGLRTLHAQGTVASDDGFVALSRSQSLESLWGRECPSLTGRGFEALADMPRLQKLSVSCKRVEDAALATLPRFPALTSLTTIDISDDGFRHVGRCAGMEALSCMYCRDTTDVATGHLAGLSRLKTYYAGMTRITDVSLEVLARLSSLESLEFWQVAGITDAGVAQLTKLPQLRSLSINGSSKVTRAVTELFREGVLMDITG
jgi:hypothetical protein